MKIIYFSKTKNIERFVKKVEYECHNGNEINKIDDKFILITYTTGFGETPEEVTSFLEKNHSNLIGVVGSGNKNWGIYYCLAAKDISKKYDTKLLMCFELAGNKHDVLKFDTLVKGMCNEKLY